MTSSPPALSLSDLSIRIDIRAFYSRYVTISGKPTNSRNEGKEQACSCPVCFGTDRASFWESGRFSCIRGTCKSHCSSPYFFLRDLLNMSHSEALEELDISQDEIGYSSPSEKVKLPLFLTSEEPPSKKWQERAGGFCRACEYILWGPKGESALRYLHSRGLKDETIKQAHLGLNPDWYKAPLEQWGLSPEQLLKEDNPFILIPKGITIPWFTGDDIWKIQLRRPEPGPDGSTYFEVLGSSECLYSLQPIEPGCVVSLEEAELDALSVHQEASDVVTAVATGSASKGQAPRISCEILRASVILQGFDTDEAGEKGAEQWLKLFGEKCYRWGPDGHDWNDMLKAGQDIRAWIKSGLHIREFEAFEAACEQIDIGIPATQPPAMPDNNLDKNGRIIPPELIERVHAFQSRPCTSCGGYDWFLENGRLLCPCIKTKRAMNERLAFLHR